jgi:hypothetical protein
MNTVVFTRWSVATVTRRAAAPDQVITSPPTTFDTFEPAMISGADLLYLKLHGLPKQAYLYGDGLVTACSANQIAQANLTDCIVFAAVCHLPETPFMPALFHAGARAVVAGHGSNYAARTRVYGADMLGMLFRRLLQLKVPPALAFRFAKAKMARGRQDRYTRDALQFQYHSR